MKMTTSGTTKGVLRRYQQSPEEIRKYFEGLPDLVNRSHAGPILGYLFSKIEYAKRRTIYCGIAKLHRAETGLTWNIVTADHLSRDKFKRYFRTVFGRPISPDLSDKLESAEATRDNVAHGKPFTDAQVRQAVVDVLEFAEGFNVFVHSVAGFKPFGKLSGFKGRLKPLGKSTTRWILKGMGFRMG